MAGGGLPRIAGSTDPGVALAALAGSEAAHNSNNAAKLLSPFIVSPKDQPRTHQQRCHGTITGPPGRHCCTSLKSQSR
jgi:hypothetical protein